MKSTLFAALIVLRSTSVYAAASPEKAVYELLRSQQLQDAKKDIANYALSNIEVIQTGRDGSVLKINLKYRWPQTQDVCRLAGAVRYSEMEVISPGGGGYEIREFYNVSVEPGCGI